jgi:uncharacterized membrane protein
MDTNRLETFSDGVFAIAITLLVLEIAVPPQGTSLGVELLGLWPSYVAYLISFLVIGAIWMNHHAMFRHIVRTDGTLMLLNLLNLMLVAFLAAAFTHGADESLAAAVYGGTLAVLGLFVVAVWEYASRDHRLISDALTTDQARAIGRRYLLGPVGYAVATGFALVLPWLAVLFYLCLNVFYLWPKRSKSNADTRG